MSDIKFTAQTPFSDYLSGDKAFWTSSTYAKDAKQEFGEKTIKSSFYECKTQKKWVRTTKQVISIIIFPIGIYLLIQKIASKIILPSSNKLLISQSLRSYNRAFGTSFTNLDELRASVIDEKNQGEWKYKRIGIQVDGMTIDAVIVGKEKTLQSGRWMLHSGGNGEFYEFRLKDQEFKPILSDLHCNALYFNYPGVASSAGVSNKSTIEKAYRACLTFLEDEKNGVGAKEIIGYGFSIGGGVQGTALKKHKLKSNIKYVFVKDRTFSNIRTAASKMMFPPVGLLATILGINFDSIKSSTKLKVPEIIIQSGKSFSSYEFTKKKQREKKHSIIGDGVIPAKASLGVALLKSKKDYVGKKILIQDDLDHVQKLNYLSRVKLTEEINKALI